MRQHAFTPIRGHDPQRNGLIGTNRILMRMIHGARVEGRDLIVIEIGGDVGLRRIGIRDLEDIALVDPTPFEPTAVGREILAHRPQRPALPTQEAQIVGNVPGTSAELTAHLWNQKRHVEHVHLVGKNVFPEALGKDHDGIEGK